MSFKIADGYVEVHARHDRASTRRNAREAANDAEDELKKKQGMGLAWLFKTNPKLMKMLEAPLGSIFGSPVIFAAASVAILGVAGFAATAISTAILTGIAGGFIAGGAWVHANDKVIVGAYTKMKDKIRGVFYRASQPLVEPLVRAMGMIGDAVKRWEPAFSRIYQALAPLIEPFTGGVLGFIEAMLPGIERSLPGIQVVMLSLAEHLPGLGTAIGDFFATLAENGPLLKDVVGLMITWLENFFKVAGPVIVFFMESFVGMAIEWKYFMDALKATISWIDDTWHAIPGWWDETWGAVSGWFKNLWNDITGFFSDTGTTISTWWNDQINNISTWWSQTWGSVTTWFSELPGRIGGFLSSLPGTIAGWFGQAFDAVTYGFGYAIGTWVGFMIALPGRLWAAVTGGLTFIHQQFVAWMGRIAAFIVTSWNNNIAFWSQVPGRVHRWMLDMAARVIATTTNIFNSVTGWFARLPGALARYAQDTWNRVTGFFNWALHTLPQTMANMNNRIVAAIAGLGARLWNAGRDAIVGLVNGIQSLLGWAVDAAWRAARNIAQGFMDALHIGSPSKYMADQVGKWIPAGIMVGIEDNMGPLDKFAKDWGRDFPDTFGAPARAMAGNTTTTSTDQSTNYGNVTVEVHVDNIQELADIQAFLDGRMRNSPKARTWSGNLYEAQGEYVRSYQ